MKVLNNSRLILGIENDVFPPNFFYFSAMDSHSKSEVLEIFNMG